MCLAKAHKWNNDHSMRRQPVYENQSGWTISPIEESGKVTDLEQVQLIKRQSVREGFLIFITFQNFKIWRAVNNLIQNLTQNEGLNSFFDTSNVFNSKSCFLKKEKNAKETWILNGNYLSKTWIGSNCYVHYQRRSKFLNSKSDAFVKNLIQTLTHYEGLYSLFDTL